MTLTHHAILWGLVGTGALLIASPASAGCPAGSYYVTSNNDPARLFASDTRADLWFTQDQNGSCTGSLVYGNAGSSTFSSEVLANFSASGIYFYWSGNAPSGNVNYNARASIYGSLSVDYRSNTGAHAFTAQRTVAPRLIRVTNAQSTQVTNAHVYIDATIGGYLNSANTVVSDFSVRYDLGVNMLDGWWDGSRWNGSLYLEAESFAPPQKQVVIGKLDSRDFNSARVAIWFLNADGQYWYDYEDIGNWTESSPAVINLTMNTAGVSCAFDGQYCRGDFLHH